MSKYQIPFDANGNPLNYAREYGWNRIEWKDNYIFEASLVFDHFQRGRSAAHAIFNDGQGRKFTMFLAELSKAIPSLEEGQLVGYFTFCKRGQNYGIKFLGTEQMDEDEDDFEEGEQK